METLIIIGLILVILGIIGSVLPVLPGPILSYIALWLLYFAKPEKISMGSLIIFGVLMAILIILDYLAPILGAKFSGASKFGLAGCIMGSILGLIFFPPLGIFIGALLGAILGEIAHGKNFKKSVKAGVGTILGSFSVIILQTIFSLTLLIYFLWKIFS